MSSATTWIEFFSKAGIPRSQCDNYAHIFVKNRILMNMLSELNKEYLREMGITSIGDIISILRHSKTVIDLQSREQILSHTSSNNVIVDKKPKIIRITAESTTRSSPASTTQSTVRRVLPEHEGKYKVSLPKGSTEKSREILAKYSAMKSDKVDEKKSVFERLQSQKIVLSNKPAPVVLTATSSSIFRRLGDYKEVDLRAEKRSSGILKNSPIKKARTTIMKEKTIKKAIIRTSSMRSDRVRPQFDSDDDEDMMDADSKQVSFSPKVEVREFEEDADTIASKRQSANLTISVKSRLDLHPRAIKLTPNKASGNVGGRGNIRKSVVMKPKKFANVGTLKSDGIKQGKSVKSRLDLKKINQSRPANRNGSGSVFNRLNR